MKKYIYKITNKINNKVYIGQTNNMKRRVQEHKHDKRKNKPITNAINKYGFENFIVSILYHGQNYNAEEIKYIDLYKSNNKSFGYNITSGGEDNFGDNNPMSKITNLIANNIIEDLLNTSLMHKEIAKKHNVPITIVNHINIGEAWRNDNYDYPIKKKYLNQEQIMAIINELKNTKDNFTIIADKFNLDRMVIQNINTGSTYNQSSLRYPIRKRFINEDTANEIKTLLETTNLFYKEIAKETDSSISIVSKINKGDAWKDNERNYPIRHK